MNRQENWPRYKRRWYQVVIGRKKIIEETKKDLFNHWYDAILFLFAYKIFYPKRIFPEGGIFIPEKYRNEIVEISEHELILTDFNKIDFGKITADIKLDPKEIFNKLFK